MTLELHLFSYKFKCHKRKWKKKNHQEIISLHQHYDQNIIKNSTLDIFYDFLDAFFGDFWEKYGACMSYLTTKNIRWEIWIKTSYTLGVQTCKAYQGCRKKYLLYMRCLYGLASCNKDFLLLLLVSISIYLFLIFTFSVGFG